MHTHTQHIDGIFNAIGLSVITEKGSIKWRIQNPGYSNIKGQLDEGNPGLIDGE